MQTNKQTFDMLAEGNILGIHQHKHLAIKRDKILLGLFSPISNFRHAFVISVLICKWNPFT